jgi:uncharacterized pyridoxamine 5'-phosphate oxidase family protein
MREPGLLVLTLIRSAITTRLLDLKRTRGVTLITRHVNNSTAITSAAKSCSARHLDQGGAVDVSEFLAQPLVARLAVTGNDGHPTVRPVWFLFEDKTFWWLTASSYSRLQDLLAVDPAVALVVDSCDLNTGQVLAVTARGQAVVHALDRQRAVRKITKYLGPAAELWPSRFQDALTDPTTRLISLQPAHDLVLRDISYDPPVK